MVLKLKPNTYYWYHTISIKATMRNSKHKISAELILFALFTYAIFEEMWNNLLITWRRQSQLNFHALVRAKNCNRFMLFLCSVSSSAKWHKSSKFWTVALRRNVAVTWGNMYIEKWHMSDGNNYGSLNIYKSVPCYKNTFLNLKDSVMLEVIFVTFCCSGLCVTSCSFGFRKLIFTILSQLQD